MECFLNKISVGGNVRLSCSGSIRINMFPPDVGVLLMIENEIIKNVEIMFLSPSEPFCVVEEEKKGFESIVETAFYSRVVLPVEKSLFDG